MREQGHYLVESGHLLGRHAALLPLRADGVDEVDHRGLSALGLRRCLRLRGRRLLAMQMILGRLRLGCLDRRPHGRVDESFPGALKLAGRDELHLHALGLHAHGPGRCSQWPRQHAVLICRLVERCLVGGPAGDHLQGGRAVQPRRGARARRAGQGAAAILDKG